MLTSAQFVDLLRRHDRFTKGLIGGERADLKHQNFSGLRLPGINFRNAILAGADFGRCFLHSSDFTQADLFGASFKFADATGTTFERADLRGSDFHGATLKDSSFKGADMRPGLLMTARDEQGRQTDYFDGRTSDQAATNLRGSDMASANLS